jgi:hypothetical protein
MGVPCCVAFDEVLPLEQGEQGRDRSEGERIYLFCNRHIFTAVGKYVKRCRSGICNTDLK